MEHYFEFIHRWRCIHPTWNGDLIELSDKAKDEAVYIWLTNHESWYPEIYPEPFSLSLCRLATKVLFEEKYPSDDFLMLIFEAADDSDLNGDTWWSEAMKDISEYFDSSSFIEECRNSIYLYLESAMREQIKETYSQCSFEEDNSADWARLRKEFPAIEKAK